MRILSVVLAVLMILFAVVQYNDPDGLKWMFIYGVPALLAMGVAVCPHAFKSPVLQGIIMLCIVAAIAGTIYYWPKSENWWSREVWWDVETAREGMGMMITVVVLSLIYLAQHRLRKQHQSPD